MYHFYLPNISNKSVELSTEQAKHCLVLRKKVGDIIHFTDGKGSFYEAELVDLTKRGGIGNVISERTVSADEYELHIAVAATKNNDRLETFIEKATEIGIHHIHPIQCDRSERKKIRLDRLERIAIAAMKQSLQAFLPTIHPMVSFSDFMKIEKKGSLLVAFCDEERTQSLTKYVLKPEIWILIGPEGDFSENEIKQSFDAGFKPISLGPNRLRTETAAIQSASWVRHFFENQ